MSEYKPVVGIDLGTTFSAIAFIDTHGKPVVIPNKENTLITPSVVHFYHKDNKVSFVVGEEAVNNLLVDQQNTVSFIKTKIGNSDFRESIYGKEYTPQEISAFILKKLKEDAEHYFTHQGMEAEVKDAVITVPAYFGMMRKGATKEAGEIAGLNVLMIIDEPTAAALAYGINKRGKDQTVFVFDLGGGTFDVTILEIKGNDINMIATAGNPKLGGKDWDDLLAKHCSCIFKEKYGNDPHDDPQSYQEFYARVVRSKIWLSTKSKQPILISHAGNSENVEMTRGKFEELSKDLLAQCKSLSERVLKKADKAWNDIDNVLLVGGSTYMPMVRTMIKEISGKEPSTDVNPDQCVAIGAAYQAKYEFVEEEVKKAEEQNGEEAAEELKRELLGSLPDIKITESVAKSIGIIVKPDETGKEVAEMITEQTEIPQKVEGDFKYAYDNQTSAKAEVTEGRGDTRDEVRVVGEILLENLPPRPVGSPIKVSINYNRDKTLDIEVVDVETGKKQEGRVVLEGSMTNIEKKASREHIARMQQQ